MLHLLKTIIAFVVLLQSVATARTVNSRAISSYTPVAYHIGKESPSKPDQFQHCGSVPEFALDASSPTLSLDYDAEVAGFPYVEISSFTEEYAQIELKYSEPYEGLSLSYGDGPWLFVNGLMNSFRTETFNITGPGRIESFFLQGGQRWQSIKLGQSIDHRWDMGTLYTSTLTSTDVLAEYPVAANSANVCLDGAKRDRLIWIGDFAHTARMLAASTGGYDLVRSMIEYEFEWQLTRGDGAGLVPIQEAMGDGWRYRYKYYSSQYGENDYFILFLLTVGDYYALTEDVALMEQYWNGTKALVDTLRDRFLDPVTSLLADPNDVLWFTAQGAQNATAPTALFVISLKGLVPIATALGD